MSDLASPANFPCDRGTGTPVGYHRFAFSNGASVCEWCGRIAGQGAPIPPMPTTHVPPMTWPTWPIGNNTWCSIKANSDADYLVVN